jgi:type IV secretion system protein VirD4
MTAKKLMLLAAPALMMLGIVLALQGIESWLAAFGTSPESYLTLGRIGLAVPYAAAAAIGVIFLFAANGSLAIQSAGLGVLIGGLAAVAFGAISEAQRLSDFASQVPDGTVFSFLDLYTIGGAATAFVAGMFGLRVALRGNAAFGWTAPRSLVSFPRAAASFSANVIASTRIQSPASTSIRAARRHGARAASRL